jgi:simple sugar transport system ATP-binding protein
MVPLMPIWRNFFLGAEPSAGPTRFLGPFRLVDRKAAKRIADEELAGMGIAVRDINQLLITLSGGERQSVATARAVYFGARVLILDEPTSALGVRQSGIVLRQITQARARGLAVIFISHNPFHAYMVGDHFVILKHGRCTGEYRRDEISRSELINEMAAGAELDELQRQLLAVTENGPEVDREQ